MSKERSPRELCSTTMGTRGITYSFSTDPLSQALGGPVYPRARRLLGRAVRQPQRALAHVEPDGAGAAQLERLAQHREVRQQAVAAVVRPAEVERVERRAARLGRQARRDEQVARDHGAVARVD